MRTHARRMMIAHERAAAHRPMHAHRAEIGDPITLAVAVAWATETVVTALTAVGVASALAVMLAPMIVGALVSAGIAGAGYLADRAAEFARGEGEDAKYARDFLWDSGPTTQAEVDRVCKNLIDTLGKDRGTMCAMKVQARWKLIIEPFPIFHREGFVQSLDQLKAISGEMGSNETDTAKDANVTAQWWDPSIKTDAQLFAWIRELQKNTTPTTGIMVLIYWWARWQSIEKPKLIAAARANNQMLDAQGEPYKDDKYTNPQFDYTVYPKPPVFTRATGPAASSTNRLLSAVTLLPRDYKTGKLVPPPAPPPPAAPPLAMLPAKLPTAPISTPAKVAAGISGASIATALLFALLRRL